MALTPIIVEQTPKGERAYDIFSRLMKDRIIFMGSVITDDMANVLTAQMLFLQTDDPKTPISLYINSPGGLVTATLAIYDTMRFLKCPVHTFCIGQAASGAAVLLAAGEPGKRHVLPHSRVMIHQPHGGASGQVTDIQIQADEYQRMKDQINKILADHTGKTLKEVVAASERDNFMSANEAKKFGLIDKVVSLGPVGQPKKR